MQAAIWGIFFSFGYIYFNRKSVLLAATWTTADATLAFASLLTALKDDKQTGLYYTPLLVWTSFATTLAVYQALTNNDPVFKTKAPLN